MCGQQVEGLRLAWRWFEHFQPLAPPTAKSGDKSCQIGQKLGVGSAELPVGTPARRPEIGIFGLFLQIDVPVRQISYSFANIWLK
jgi:hypothetical protein